MSVVDKDRMPIGLEHGGGDRYRGLLNVLSVGSVGHVAAI